VLAAVFLIALACTPTPPSIPADPDGEIRIVGSEPVLHHLDPQQALFTTEVGQVSLLFDTLLTYDRSGVKLVPALAESLPQVSADGLSYTVRLRSGLVYSDGRALKAGDFVFAYRHLCDPATASEFAFAAAVVAGCERFHADDATRTPPDQLARDRDAVGVSAADDRTVTYRLAARAAYFPHLLASWLTAPTREDIVARGDSWTEAGTLVGNGLFRLVSWTHRQRMVFERNDLHQPKAKLKRIVMELAVSGASAAFAAFRNGEIDVLSVSADLKAAVESDPGLAARTVALDSPCTTFFALNVRRPPFDDANVRLAFAKSFDRETWSREQLAGLGAPIATFIPPGIPGHDAADDTQALDVSAARALIAHSRYAAGLPPVRLTITGTAAAKRQFQPVLDAWHAAFGVDAELSPVDPTTAREILSSPGTLPQMTVQGWCAAYPDPQDFLSLVFTSVSTVGHTNYANPAYDDLVRRADAETDPALRAGLYRDAQRILTKDAPAIFASSARSKTLIAERVHGQSITPFDRIFSQFTLSDVYVPLPPASR
jgi:ABC-type oligopeptide transport system substrate-binding subunit